MEDLRIEKLQALLTDETFVRGLAEQLQPEDAQAYFAAHGLDFTKDEILQMGRALNARLKQQRGEELTEDELAEVSGGCLSAVAGLLFLGGGCVLSAFLGWASEAIW